MSSPATAEGAGAPWIDINEVSAGRDLAITLGITGEEVRAAMTDQKALHDLKVRLGVTEGALRNFFSILNRKVPSEQWPERLAEIAMIHRETQQRLDAYDSEDHSTDRLAEEARSAIGSGDYKRANRVIDQLHDSVKGEVRSRKEMEKGIKQRGYGEVPADPEHAVTTAENRSKVNVFRSVVSTDCNNCYAVGVTKNTPNNHREGSAARGWADRVSYQEICVETLENRYLKDGKLSCCCQNPCGYFSYGQTFNINDGSEMCVKFKTWGRPVAITLTAKSCPK